MAEFFEKKRIQNRHNVLAPPPAAPDNCNAGNMDLLTMFIVNQIALKKDASDARIKHLPKLKGNHKFMGGESLELPMSPCSPSRLSLEESESHYSERVLSLRKRKPGFLDEFKVKTLSPLLETNLSDNNSTSVCQHRVQGSVGSFSSASQSSLEAFNLQTRPTVNISPSLPKELHCTEPAQRGCVSIVPGQRLIKPPRSALQMESSYADSFGERTTKNHFRKEEPHLTGSHKLLATGRGHGHVSERAWELPVTCSYREDYITSNDVTISPPNLSYAIEKELRQDDNTHKYVRHSKDILTANQSCRSGTSAPTRVTCDHNRREKGNEPYGTVRQINHKQNTEEDQFVPSCLLTKTESDKMHKKTQDKATQTAGFSSRTSQDASVQCCLLKATRMLMFTKPTTHLHYSRTHKASATRRQTHHRSKNAVLEIPKVEQNTSWIMAKQEPTEQGPGTIRRNDRSSKSENQLCIEHHLLLPPSRTKAPELKEQPAENMLLRRERCEGHEESVNQNPTVNSSRTGEPSTSTAETGGHRESEGSIKEIADILLMLKQKKKH
ncbi:hypothetical protein Baya_0036 [Bagarius yarrelli]|uniref:Uncharacterized protein n=1 Tax=Bagarius yarrelli TaxID=175774 RepID=A0A556TH42_BAGYA|nr:hypothetical protein Baya_0036 [Bagarius yarrelli]